MRFETAQVLEVAGISKDTLRHWKKALPPIAHLDGRSAKYSLAELIGVCVVARAVEGLGVTVSHMAKCSQWLFSEVAVRCAHCSGVLYLLPDGSGIWLEADRAHFEAAIVIKIDPIVEHIRRSLAQGSVPDIQLSLPL